MSRLAIARTALRPLTQSGILPPELWKRLPAEMPFRVVLPTGDSFDYAPVVDDAIGRALFWRGTQGWETETITVFCHLARHARLVVDVGANTGAYTLIACAVNPDARVIAFEPVPRVFERLIRNIELNAWQMRVTPQQMAVSNYCGTATLAVCPGDCPTSSSLHIGGFRGRSGASLVEVPVTSLDRALSGVKDVDLIKIDVEGFEDRVLDGMKEILFTARPSVVMEVLPDGPYARMEATLKEHSYRFFHLVHGGLIARDGLLPDERDTFRNYLCVARPDGVATLLNGGVRMLSEGLHET